MTRWAVLAAAAFVTWVISAEAAVPGDEVPFLPVAAFAGSGLVAVAVGVWLHDRRPTNRTGLLIVALGLAELLGASGNLTDPWAALPGRLFPGLSIAALLHLAVAFPAGIVGNRLDRALVVVAYAANATTVFEYVATAPDDYPFTIGSGAELAADAAQWTGRVLRLVIAVAVMSMVLRWRRLRRDQGRAAVAVVLVSGVVALAGLVVGVYVNRVLDLDPVTYFYVQISLLGIVPPVVAAAMLSGALARTADVHELASWFGADTVERPHPRDALARALGDPTLQLLYESPPRSHHWVDHLGHRVPEPRTTPGRAVVPVGSRPGIVVTYDSTLQPDPAPVVAAIAVAALAIDHERLTAELSASEIEVRESRRRIVESAAEARRLLARDLHDGAQAHLLAAGLTAGRLALRAESSTVDAAALHGVRADIERAADELRRVVEGVMPSLLIEQGLFAAVASFVRDLPVDTHLSTEGADTHLDVATATAAYFVLAEATANAVKHARAAVVRVHLGVADGRLRIQVHDDGVGGVSVGAGTLGPPRESGLSGMRDRVLALGGRFEIDSELGEGTRVRAEFPCVS